jgi:hypothetical protein
MGGPHNIPSFGTVSRNGLGSSASLGKEKICRAFHRNHSTIEYTGIAHGGFRISIGHELFNCAAGLATFQRLGSATWHQASDVDPLSMVQAVARGRRFSVWRGW